MASRASGTAEISFYCDDIAATVRGLAATRRRVHAGGRGSRLRARHLLQRSGRLPRPALPAAIREVSHARSRMFTPPGFTPAHAMPRRPSRRARWCSRSAARRSSSAETRSSPSILTHRRARSRPASTVRAITSASTRACTASRARSPRMRTTSTGCATPACARCSSRSPSRWSRSPPARSRSSNGIARTASAAAAARRRTTRPGERAKECAGCGYVAYPRVSPAMMALVTRGREMLLARSHRFPQGMYSALAGFVEAGRDDRGLHRSRGARGGRCRSVANLALFREPVVVVSALADDRVHSRIRGRRDSLRRRARSPKRAGSTRTRFPRVRLRFRSRDG